MKSEDNIKAPQKLLLYHKWLSDRNIQSRGFILRKYFGVFYSWRVMLEFRLLIIAVCLFFYIERAAPDTIDNEPIPGEKHIVFGGDYCYPPFEFLDENGVAAGFNVDLMRFMGDTMGWKVEFRLGSWDRILGEFQEGKIHVLGMFRSKERERSAEFSKPHSILYHIIFVRKDSPAIDSIDQLYGCEVIVQNMTFAHDFLRTQNIGADLIPVKTEPEAMRLLASGKHDCAVVTRIGGNFAIKKHGLANLKSSSPPILPVEYCFTVARGDTVLLRQINEGLRIARLKGLIEKLNNTWIEKYRFYEPTFLEIIRYAFWILVVLILIIFFIFFWSWSLKKQIALRTREIADELQRRKQAEDALRESEEKFRGIFESNMLGTLFWNANGEISDANDAFLEIVGYSRAELESGKLRWNELTPPEYVEIDKGKLTEVAEKGVIDPFEKEYIHKSGRRIPIVLSAATLSGEDSSGVAIILDITERKRMEEELAKKNKELEQIIYITSHDLRSPLVNVQGFSKELAFSVTDLIALIKKDDLPRDVAEKAGRILTYDIPESLQFIQSSISKMDTLLNGLLRLSRMGRAALTMEKLDMNKILDDVSRSLEFKLKENGAKLEIKKLPPCIGDKIQVDQLFSNLMHNALKYLDTHRSGIIKVSGRKKKEQSVYCVEDNGIGIAPEYHDKIFEIFQRLYPEEGPGEGLGLTIVLRILDRHNGKIWVESEAGKGSKFFVSLPAA